MLFEAMTANYIFYCFFCFFLTIIYYTCTCLLFYSQLNTLEGCIEGKVLNCGRAAASLSQDLVKATVPLSQYCEPEIIVIIHPLVSIT